MKKLLYLAVLLVAVLYAWHLHAQVGALYYGPTQNVAAGTAVMTTAAITAPACGTTVTVAAPQVVATDVIVVSFNAAPAGTNAGLVSWPTAGNVNFAYCPGVTETPAAATINWKVSR
jgi:DNA uptake protein ComE-like DNA-binding protein